MRELEGCLCRLGNHNKLITSSIFYVNSNNLQTTYLEGLPKIQRYEEDSKKRIFHFRQGGALNEISIHIPSPLVLPPPRSWLWLLRRAFDHYSYAKPPFWLEPVALIILLRLTHPFRKFHRGMLWDSWDLMFSRKSSRSNTTWHDIIIYKQLTPHPRVMNQGIQSRVRIEGICIWSSVWYWPIAFIKGHRVQEKGNGLSSREIYLNTKL